MIGFYDRKSPPKPANDPLFDEVLTRVRRDFTIIDGPDKKVPMRHINDIDESKVTLNTNPGYPYYQMGFTKKAECFGLAKAQARYLGHRIKDQLPVRLPPTMVFMRNAVTEKGKTKLRGVWGKSFSLLLLEMSVAQPWLERAQVHPGIPTAFRTTLFHQGYRELYNKATSVAPPGTVRYVGMDFRKYDTSLPPWLLRIARGIIYDQIDFSKYEGRGHPDPVRSQRLAWRLFKGTIDTEFIMPDGYMWTKDTGTDSGSYLFQRDEDICTAIMVLYALGKQGRKILYYTILGDDSFVVVEGSYPIDQDRLAYDILRTFGVELNREKSYDVTSLENATFLGRKIYRGFPRRDVVDIVFAAMYPKNTDKTPYDAAQRFVALMYENAKSNDTAERFLKLCWENLPTYVRDYGERGEIAWKQEHLKMFRASGLTRPPKCKPPTTDLIMYLLLTPRGWSNYTFDY